MHEMSYMINFINMAEKAADGAEAITSVTVKIGALTGVLPEYLKKYFPQAAKNTRCEGADFNVIAIPAEVTCDGCGKNYQPGKDNNYCCPSCGSKDGKIIHGRELDLSSVTVR